MRSWPKIHVLMVLSLVAPTLSGCYLVNFFKKDKSGGGGEENASFTGTVLGQPLGDRAGGPNEAALAALYAVGTTHMPAALRPDPDLYVRRLLRQYRPEGATVAREIGQVEAFRLLLGGASQDFAKSPQDTYDATSLLAVSKVAEEACRGLVAPNAAEHPGWSTILPYPADQEQANIAWLAQRIIGKPSAKIDPAVVPQLTAIMTAEEPFLKDNWWAAGNDYAKYIPVCSTLALDAEALYF